MEIIHKNTGAYVPYTFDGAAISFRGGELGIDLAAERGVCASHIVVSEDEGGRLVRGFGRRYVAELDLPGREFRMEPKGYADDLGIEQVRRVEQPFDESRVTLSLWAMEG